MLRKLVLIMLLLVLAGGLVLFAGDGEVEAWMEMASPGEHHKHIARMEGKWEVEASFWYTPDTKPQVASGLSTSRFILDGRYLETEYVSEVNGMPFAGRGIMGYDRVAGEYVDIWVDSMGTGIMVMRGSCSDDGRVITLKGEHVDPATRERIKIRSVTSFADDDHFRVEMWNRMPGGAEFKSMELSYTRK